jgi:hypothetical protein
MKRPQKMVPLFMLAPLRRLRETAATHRPRERRGASALVLAFLLCLFGPAAHAQEASGARPAQDKPAASGGGAESQPGESDDCNGSDKVQCISDKLKAQRLGWGGRIARGLQYQYQLNEQTGWVIVGNPAEIVRNPEDYLQQHTFTFKFGELMPDRLTQFKRWSDYLKKYPQDAEVEPGVILCGNKPLVTCLTKGGRWWQRALMGTSVSLTVSERAAVSQGFIVTDPKFGQDYQVNGGFTFDPAKIFPSASTWKGTFDEVQKVDKALAYLGASDAYDRKQPWKENLWLAAILPKVEFKVLSQFEFVKFKDALIIPPIRERALNTFTFTWDLARAIPDTKSRMDADAIADSLNDLENGLGAAEKSSWQKRCVIHLAAGDRTLDVHTTFPARSCQQLAIRLKADTYQLSCYRKATKEILEQQLNGDPIKSAEPPSPPSATVNQCKWM